MSEHEFEDLNEEMKELFRKLKIEKTNANTDILINFMNKINKKLVKKIMEDFNLHLKEEYLK